MSEHQAIPNRTWTQLVGFPGWVYQDSGQTSTVTSTDDGFVLGPSPNGWLYGTAYAGAQPDPATALTFEAGTVLVPPPTLPGDGWRQTGMSSLVEWDRDGCLFIDGVQQPGHHDLP